MSGDEWSEEDWQQALSHHERASEYFDTGLLLDAVSEWRAAIRIAPYSAHMHQNLAVALEQSNQILDAIAHYREAVRLEPDLYDSHASLARLLVRRLRDDKDNTTLPEDIRQSCSSALAFAPSIENKAFFLGHLGKAEWILGDRDAGIKHLEAATALVPRMEGYNALVHMYLHTGRWRQAWKTAMAAVDYRSKKQMAESLTRR